MLEGCNRRHLPALEVSWVGAVGDERYTGRARGGPVHPRIPNDDRLGSLESTSQTSRRRCHFTDHAPAVGVGLELTHLVPGDGDVEEHVEAKAREGVQGDLACVVRPQRGVEPGSAGPGTASRAPGSSEASPTAFRSWSSAIDQRSASRSGTSA